MHLTRAFSLVLAVCIVGCGGGGSSLPPAPMPQIPYRDQRTVKVAMPPKGGAPADVVLRLRQVEASPALLGQAFETSGAPATASSATRPATVPGHLLLPPADAAVICSAETLAT